MKKKLTLTVALFYLFGAGKSTVMIKSTNLSMREHSDYPYRNFLKGLKSDFLVVYLYIISTAQNSQSPSKLHYILNGLF